MFEFFEDHIEIDPEFESEMFIRFLSTREFRINSIFTKYYGAAMPDGFIKSLKITNMKNKCEEVFKIIDIEGNFLFNSDEIPYYYYTGFLETIFINIKKEDETDYKIEVNLIDEHFIRTYRIYEKLQKFSKQNNCITYVLKNKVIKGNFSNGRLEILEEPLYDISQYTPTFSQKVKSSSKSANKRSYCNIF